MKKRKRRTYKYQIREHPQKMRIGNMLDDLGDVHNHFLKLENRYYRIYGKYAGRYRLQPHLTKLLERTKKHWVWIPRDTLDEVIIRLHLAWERFFDFPHVGRPKFKKRGKYRSAKFKTGYKVSDLAFGAFVEILAYKCFKHNRDFRQVGQWTATTKPCSGCGHHNENLSLSDRQWTCRECGSHHDRDVNAALNILRAACGPAVEQM